MKIYVGKGFAIRIGDFCVGFGNPKGLREDMEREGIDRRRPHRGV